MLTTYRDGLSLEEITNEHYRRWYDEDRLRIGSSWTPTGGGAFFMPNMGMDAGWILQERDGDHMVLINPDTHAKRDNRYRLCYDGGFDRFRVLAFSLRPEGLYRYNGDRNAFFRDPAGDAVIEGEYPNYHLRGDMTPLHIGPDLGFYYEEQSDVYRLAMSGALGNIVDSRPTRSSTEVVIRRCESCGKVMPSSAKKSDKFCSVACGMNVTNGPKMYVCKCCGGPFKRTGSGQHRYCSDRCRDASKKQAQTKSTYQCFTCNEPFHRAGSGQHRYCSDECRKVHDRQMVFPRSATCGHCGTNFRYVSPGPAKRYCSNFCKTMG